MDYQFLGSQVRKHRLKQKLTQEALAEMAQVSTSFLGHIERGSRKASLETYLNICHSLGISIETLVLPAPIPAEELACSSLQLEQARRLLELAVNLIKP